MLTALLIMLREGFEAALIVALVFAYLRRIERLDLGRSVWQGVAGAAAVAFLIGIGLRITLGGLEGASRLRAFAAVSLVAVVVLTWMVFWMRRQSRAIRGHLEQRVDAALRASNVGVAVIGVVFVAVLREGVEAALFLLAASESDNPTAVLLGGLIGLAGAAAFAYVIYLGGRKVPLRAFFQVTGVVLILFAAGLLAKAVMFLQAAGDLGSFNLNGVYDLRAYAFLTEGTQTGKFLAGILGWDPRPSIEQVVVWLSYFVPVVYLYLRPSVPAPARPAPVAEDPRNQSVEFAQG
jgi:high-affinity iron transporter